MTPAWVALALVLGVNHSDDPELRPLRYADDDAVRYAELFDAMGATTQLLTEADENTRRLHPKLVARAQRPDRDGLRRAVATLAEAAAQARLSGAHVELYITYAGHGNMRDGEAYLTLLGDVLRGQELGRELVAAIGADRTHLIIDACYSFFLAYSRGPGGSVREHSGFAELAGLPSDSVGLLLSTSTAAESHEWEALQSGIFSHEVRSGLWGAADADGDGRVGYREISAFVDRANAAIPNERFRPQVFARPPRGSDTLLALPAGKLPSLIIEGALAGQYTLEDGRGVRVADFHSAPGERVRLHWPVGPHNHYLRRSGEDTERLLPRGPQSKPIRAEALEARPPRAASRGAAHEAFSRLFELPFGTSEVEGYRYPSPEAVAPLPRDPPWRRRLAVGALVVGSAVLAAGGGLQWSASQLREEAGDLSHRRATQVNQDIERRDLAAKLLFGLGGAALVGAAVAYWWPAADDWQVSLGPGGASLRVALP